MDRQSRLLLFNVMASDAYGVDVALSLLEAYREESRAALNSIDLDDVAAVVAALLRARHSSALVLVIGNGGSAATAAHMATDLMLGSKLENPPLRVVSLVDNEALLTASGNDFGFDTVFSRQVDRLGRPGDVLIAVSASGNSPNILQAVEVAKAREMVTIALTGFDGGRLASIADLLVHVPTRVGAYGPVEDVHLAVNHMITSTLREMAGT